jgi:hypothetical protein
MLFHDFSPHRENYSSGFLQVRLKKSRLHPQTGGGFSFSDSRFTVTPVGTIRARREVITPRILTDHVLRDNLAFPVFSSTLAGIPGSHQVV